MKALRRCRNYMEVDNVVLIDVDSYNFNNVIVIDVPESHSKKVGGSTSNGLKNDRSHPLRTYIYIDDDESPSTHHQAGAHTDSERNFENGASSSRRYGLDTHFAHENISPVKLSKGKRTYSGISSNNRNSFSLQSDSDSSDDDDDDNLDCEFMEDFSGKLREQWEKASLKRKSGLQNDSGVNKNKQKFTQGSTSKEKSRQPAFRFRRSESSSSECDGRTEVDVDLGKGDSPIGDETEDCGQSSSLHRDKKCEHIPSTSSEEENEKNDLDVVLTVDKVPVESSIIDQREKLKETDEYKRALEEEWSARQIALKIQAEEAQQLRRLQKRKKAETLRLLDMERRQKQRVEEIRKTQKKDEENMNLKEVYRTEVRQELNKLEKTCLDMASLLRGLGIQVGDGPSPLSHQVRAAYKRALLSFHPDRSSGSDMRKQVEAEEKFKLISRMKEKLSL